MAELIIALDVENRELALQAAKCLHPAPVWYKIGLELFTAAGPQLVTDMVAAGHNIFLDMKFHDIPNTVYGACRSATHLGVRLLTVHTSGGAAMMEAAVKGRDSALAKSGARPAIFGITVLTSDSSFGDRAVDVVVERALEAQKAGLDGVVCSGLEAAAVKNACGPSFLCLCPGIRFAGAPDSHNDQARVSTPAQAIRNGADFLVMGRPVMQAASPLQAAQNALADMASA